MNGLDVESYMTGDQFEINEDIRDMISRNGKPNSEFLDRIYLRLRRHIFIEETILFPTLPERSREDVEYLEREHGRILDSLKTMKDLRDPRDRTEMLSDLYGLLLEHNSYEESFVYDYFQDKGNEAIRKTTLLQDNWKSAYE